MTANVITSGVQVGQSGTPAQNFVLRNNNDGTFRLIRGNAFDEGAEVLRIESDGSIVGPFLGSGQTRQTVTGSRAYGVNYTNTTTKPIMVLVTATIPNISSSITAVVGGVTANYAQGAAAAAIQYAITFIVLPGEVYSVAAIGSPTLGSWIEIR